MTTSTQQIDLPKIPSLPPIEMPDASSFLESAALTDDHDMLSPLIPSTASLVSHDTFMTADSSLFSDLNATPTTNSPELLSPAVPFVLAPPASLRKSISVDSFIRCMSASDSLTRPARGNTVSSTSKVPSSSALRNLHPVSDARAGSTSAAWPERETQPLQQRAGPSRSRGASISTATGDELDDAFLDESDMERSEDITSAARKGKTTLKRILAPGDLSLPSRLQTVSSSPTMGKPPPPIVPERRSSLSHKLTKQRSLVSVKTYLPSGSDITIAVLGAAGTGKSTIIRKGLKSYGLQEANTSSPVPGVSETFRYVYRVGRISHNHAADCLLRVLEVDVLSLDLTSDGSRGIFPEGAPPIDGLVFCYDSSESSSFKHVEKVLQCISYLKLPTIVLACKSDMDRQVDPDSALSILEQYDIGLIQVTTTNPNGKQKIRTAFEWIFKAIVSQRLNGGRDRDGYRNPASPAVLASPTPWETARAASATPTAPSSSGAHSPLLPPNRMRPARLTPASDESTQARTPASPARTRSMSDLLADPDGKWDSNHQGSNEVLGVTSTRSRGSSHTALSVAAEGMTNSFDEAQEPTQSISSRESRPPRWLTLDELLDKLLFVSVSEDDPTFVSHFLLTYRRFAIPRSILLAMQKRMRALDQSTADPMFSCYAQMKICWLLDHWIQLYPNDFAVPGTAGALDALTKSIIGKTYLLHYGAVFVPFYETLPTLKDHDASWAMKIEEPKEELDDWVTLTEAGGAPSSPVSSHTSNSQPDVSNPLPPTSAPSSAVNRERKSSLPLSAKVLVMATSPTQTTHVDHVERSWPKKLKALVRFSDQFMATDPTSLAQEISRLECQYFLRIEPRHWLLHVIGRGKKDPETDTIAQYNNISNHIANWVVSLILCHDKPKTRARAIHLFVELASRLRNMNNYSALRAVVAGINSAAFETDASMQAFKAKNAQQCKLFQSFDHLLQAVRAHGKYRMALRNSKGACIPALEIHLSDLIRAHEGNTDFHDEDLNHIHWEKFNMMGRFIDGITQCQQACRETKTYEKFPEDPRARDLLLIQRDHYLMDIEQQDERIHLDKLDNREDDHVEEATRPAPTLYHSRESPQHGRDGPLRRIFFW